MKNILKTSQLMPGMVPVSGVQQKDVGVARQRTQQTQQTPAQLARPTKEEQEQVMRMQQIMSALGKSIDSNIQDISQRINLSISELQSISGSVRNTGQGTQTPFDGKWGPKTIQALNKINKLTSSLKKVGAKNVDDVNPGKNYKTVNPESVINAAKANVDAIAKIMRRVGVAESIPSDLNVRPERYDVIPKRVSPANINASVSGEQGVGVRPSDLDSIHSFYRFVKNHLYTDLNAFSSLEKPEIEKIASRIKNASLVRLAQRAEHVEGTPAGQAAGTGRTRERDLRQRGNTNIQRDDGFDESFQEAMKSQNVQSGRDGVSVAFMDAAVQWFEQRADLVYRQAENYHASGAVGEDGKPIVTAQDLKAAKEYKNAIDVIAMNWAVERDKFLKEGQDPKTAVIDYKNLFQHKNPSKLYQRKLQTEKDTGVARTRPGGVTTRELEQLDDRGKQVSQKASREGVDIVREFPEGPISTYMDISRLTDYIGETKSANWFANHVGIKQVDRIEFGRISPRRLVDEYQKPGSNLSSREFVLAYPYHLGKILTDIQQNWRTVILKIKNTMPEPMQNQAERALKEQHRRLSAWHRILSALQSTAQEWHPGGQIGAYKPRR